ncbi:MAG TPA: hypothetical protein VF212_06180 [Longimicrobiales bacterium]
MHTEHLQNVHPLWVAAGWLVAIATTSLVALALAALGLIGPATDPGAIGIGAVALGFWIGGLFTGFRSLRAPILHGITIGLTSIVGWFVLNLLVFVFPSLRWEALTPLLTAALLLVQMAAAVAGAWVGHRIALRGGAELRE